MQVSSHPSSVSLTGLFRLPCYFRSSGVDPVPSRQGLHPHPSHCLGPQTTAMQLPPGPTRSSAPDSRDLTLHLYLRLTCRPCRQATFSPTDGRPTVPMVTASQPVWRHKMPLIGVVEPQRPTWPCVGTQCRSIPLLIRDHSWSFAPKWPVVSSTRYHMYAAVLLLVLLGLAEMAATVPASSM